VSDILITDCTFKHGHGCSFGSETSGGDRRVIVRNCTFEDTDIGVRFKSDRTRGGLVEDVVYENLTMKNVGQAIVITSYYPDRDLPKPGQHAEPKPVGDTTPKWTKITIRNVTATGCTKSAGLIIGLPESLATAITLENVKIDAPAGLRIGYAKDVTLKNVQVTAASGEAFFVEDTVTGLRRE
jgi:polygalacturonase